MGSRAIIRVGDKTSHGGVVIEGQPTFIIMGKPVARLGHKTSCPKCKGTFPIIEGVPDHFMYGQSTAVEGMKTACGALLIASQFTDTIDFGRDSPAATAAVAQQRALQKTAASGNPVVPRGDKAATHPYDEQVRIVNSEGEPIRQTPYHITDGSGKIYKGLTNDQGRCERVYTKDADTLNILIGVPALEHW